MDEEGAKRHQKGIEMVAEKLPTIIATVALSFMNRQSSRVGCAWKINFIFIGEVGHDEPVYVQGMRRHEPMSDYPGAEVGT